mmetsp:Transcript_14674/g.57576  ORF Transcript_14674/g.57576 Transcript_14674/m.57576 type:complete len:205 (-) Transcript_14674:87-701(-)
MVIPVRRVVSRFTLQRTVTSPTPSSNSSSGCVSNEMVCQITLACWPRNPAVLLRTAACERMLHCCWPALMTMMASTMLPSNGSPRLQRKELRRLSSSSAAVMTRERVWTRTRTRHVAGGARLRVRSVQAQLSHLAAHSSLETARTTSLTKRHASSPLLPLVATRLLTRPSSGPGSSSERLAQSARWLRSLPRALVPLLARAATV